MNILIFFPAIIAVVVGNIYWYTMKSILKDNGYEVHYFYGHFGDFPKFIDLIKKENDLELKTKYKRIMWSTIASGIVLLGCAFFGMTS